MFKYLDEKDKKKYKIIISSISILLILVLVLIAAYAWFSMENNSSKYANIGVGKVRYVVDSAEKMFYSAFELNADDYEEDDWVEEDGYIPATEIAGVMAGTESIEKDGSTYTYNLPAGSKVRIKPVFEPSNATDKVTYSSSNSSVISVTAYGTVMAVGIAGESATITITSVDRTPGDEKRKDLVTEVKFNVIESDDKDNKYGYLPGNVDILRNGLVVNNISTVDSKARVKIYWQYKNFDESDLEETAGYNSYSISDLYKTAGETTGKIVVGSSVKAPLILAVDKLWSAIPTESTDVVLTDKNGLQWSVDSLFLTDSDYNSLINALKANNNYTLSEKMIDSAYIYICYSNGTAITDINTDYGVAIPKTNGNDKVSYMAVDKMVTSEMYAGFSIKKVFSITVTVQARQSKAYDENNWFDVYCAKENYGADDHKAVTS